MLGLKVDLPRPPAGPFMPARSTTPRCFPVSTVPKPGPETVFSLHCCLSLSSSRLLVALIDTLLFTGTAVVGEGDERSSQGQLVHVRHRERASGSGHHSQCIESPSTPAPLGLYPTRIADAGTFGHGAFIQLTEECFSPLQPYMLHPLFALHA